MEVPKWHIEVKRGTLVWHWRIKAGNGEILATSETYYSRSNAIRAARKIADEFSWGLVVIGKDKKEK